MNYYWINKLVMFLMHIKFNLKFSRGFYLLMFLCFVPSCQQATELPNSFSSSSEIYHITSNSMEPSIFLDNTVVVDSDAYQDQFPSHGDIIAFIHPKNPDNMLIKRVIGLPQEEIEINNRVVLIDKQVLEEVYIQEQARYYGKWTMSTQEYFVLSDNRNNGSDSHNWGGLPFDNIIGKVTHICDDDSLNTCREVEEDGK